MKLLYLSCHSILEFDECSLFNELGIDWFSHGAYINPKAPADTKRPPIDKPLNDELSYLAMRYSKENLPEAFLDRFDTVIVMHVPEWIINNWARLKKKRVIWRAIGQSTPEIEYQMGLLKKEGLQIVRYSEKEREIPNYAGENAVIPFYKDPDEFNCWNGENEQVITMCQSMPERDYFCGYTYFKLATVGFPRKLFGPKNELSGITGGLLSYVDMKQELKDSRVYFYTGTYPACYTLNFIEALMTGIPIVALGEGLGNPKILGDWKMYQIPQIIKNGENGFFSDDINTLRKYIYSLLTDKALASKIGREGRKTAIKLFGKEKVKEQWKRFLL